MAFMVPEYIEDKPYEVETQIGTCIVPSELVGDDPDLSDFRDFVEGKPHSFTRLDAGIIFRLSASGYLDCTEWSYAETLEEAKEQIESLYEVDPDTGDELEENAK
jgi:hypothetical protein